MSPVRPTPAIEGYDRIADAFERERKPNRWELPFFEALARDLPSTARVLDCGCGSGHPGLAFLVEKGCDIVGLDGSEAMLGHFRRRYPGVDTVRMDMRDFAPSQRFDTIIAWNSFFHLSQADQAAMIARFAAWLQPDGRLLFTSGPSNATIEGEMFGVAFPYASFADEEYRHLLQGAKFTAIASVFDEPGADIHKVWTARRPC